MKLGVVEGSGDLYVEVLWCFFLFRVLVVAVDFALEVFVANWRRGRTLLLIAHLAQVLLFELLIALFVHLLKLQIHILHDSVARVDLCVFVYFVLKSLPLSRSRRNLAQVFRIV